MISIDREKAEDIVRDRLRQEREPALLKLDMEFTLALESGSDTSEIVQSKQVLRDITSKDLSSLSIDELANLDLETALAM